MGSCGGFDYGMQTDSLLDRFGFPSCAVAKLLLLSSLNYVIVQFLLLVQLLWSYEAIGAIVDELQGWGEGRVTVSIGLQLMAVCNNCVIAFKPRAAYSAALLGCCIEIAESDLASSEKWLANCSSWYMQLRDQCVSQKYSAGTSPPHIH